MAGVKRQRQDEGSYPAKRGPSLLDSNDAGHRANKKQKNRHSAKEGTNNWLKKRVRTIERTFARDRNLPANVRNDLERELTAHKATIADQAFHKNRSAMIKKYHMVRFFERQKASRLAKQLSKKIKSTDDPQELARLKQELHVAEVDVKYAVYFPFMERYVSLYPDDAKSATKEKQAARRDRTSERPAMWSVVEKAMAEGEGALERLRDRRSEHEAGSYSKAPMPRSARTAGKKEPQSGMTARQRQEVGIKEESTLKEDSESSDGGGFFEED